MREKQELVSLLLSRSDPCCQLLGGRMDGCRERVGYICRRDEGVPVKPYYSCKSAGCPVCAEAYSRKVQARLRCGLDKLWKGKFGEFGLFAHVTLTWGQPVPRSEVHDQAKQMHAELAKIHKQRVIPRLGKLPGIFSAAQASYSCLSTPDQPLWHVHLHCLVIAPPGAEARHLKKFFEKNWPSPAAPNVRVIKAPRCLPDAKELARVGAMLADPQAWGLTREQILDMRASCLKAADQASSHALLEAVFRVAQYFLRPTAREGWEHSGDSADAKRHPGKPGNTPSKPSKRPQVASNKHPQGRSSPLPPPSPALLALRRSAPHIPYPDERVETALMLHELGFRIQALGCFYGIQGGKGFFAAPKIKLQPSSEDGVSSEAGLLDLLDDSDFLDLLDEPRQLPTYGGSALWRPVHSDYEGVSGSDKPSALSRARDAMRAWLAGTPLADVDTLSLYLVKTLEVSVLPLETVRSLAKESSDPNRSRLLTLFQLGVLHRDVSARITRLTRAQTYHWNRLDIWLRKNPSLSDQASQTSCAQSVQRLELHIARERARLLQLEARIDRAVSSYVSHALAFQRQLKQKAKEAKALARWHRHEARYIPDWHRWGDFCLSEFAKARLPVTGSWNDYLPSYAHWMGLSAKVPVHPDDPACSLYADPARLTFARACAFARYYLDDAFLAATRWGLVVLFRREVARNPYLSWPVPEQLRFLLLVVWHGLLCGAFRVYAQHGCRCSPDHSWAGREFAGKPVSLLRRRKHSKWRFGLSPDPGPKPGTPGFLARCELRELDSRDGYEPQLTLSPGDLAYELSEDADAYWMEICKAAWAEAVRRDAACSSASESADG